MEGPATGVPAMAGMAASGKVPGTEAWAVKVAQMATAETAAMEATIRAEHLGTAAKAELVTAVDLEATVAPVGTLGLPDLVEMADAAETRAVARMQGTAETVAPAILVATAGMAETAPVPRLADTEVLAVPGPIREAMVRTEVRIRRENTLG